MGCLKLVPILKMHLLLLRWIFLKQMLHCHQNKFPHFFLKGQHLPGKQVAGNFYQLETPKNNNFQLP